MNAESTARASRAVSTGRGSGRALVACLRLVLRLSVMPRCFGMAGRGRSGDENWVDHIGEHSAGGLGRLWPP